MTDVLYLYAWCIDTNNLDDLRHVFTEDCVAHYHGGPGGTVHGIAELRTFLAAALSAFSATHHSISNIRLRPEAQNRAAGICSVDAWRRRTGWAEESDDCLWGWYDDRLTRTSEGWRIAERTLFVAGVSDVARTQTRAGSPDESRFQITRARLEP